MWRTRNVPEPQAMSSQSLIRRTRSAVRRAAVELVEQLRGEPVGRVVFAEVVAQFLRHQVLVKPFQQVARAVGVGVQRNERIGGELLHDGAQGLVNFGRPVFEIPTEEVAFEEVADAKVTEDAAFFHCAADSFAKPVVVHAGWLAPA